MTPTPKLRFVERETPVGITGMMVHVETILQQWWEDRNIALAIHIEDKDGNPLPSPNRGEWRDVPVEKEK